VKWLAITLAAGLACGDAGRAQVTAQQLEQQEQVELNSAVSEAGTSSIDFTHALERHLAKYPESKQRLAIEKALAKSAMESNDRSRIVLYGERVLTAEPRSDDFHLIDRVTQALLESDEPEPAKRALEYAKRYQHEVDSMRSRAAEGHMTEAQWSAEVDRAMARVLTLQARATGDTGNPEEAVKLAQSSWDLAPSAEGARELGRWLAKLNRLAPAIEYYADAFAMDDMATTSADRTRDRARLAELSTKLNGSEKGLGDLVLAAYDRTAALRKQILANMKRKDPNAGLSDLMDYTLAPADGGEPLTLASLKGKTVVMDFWATWCGPCKVQHPMIEKIRTRYEKSGDVVFLSVDSDDDHSLVAPFLKDMKWSGRFFFDSGLARMLTVSSIPTVIVLDKQGRISSRMVGFIPERFEEMLTQRIDETKN
jgi:thiol-disulfide isomerase/thioredoxin